MSILDIIESLKVIADDLSTMGPDRRTAGMAIAALESQQAEIERLQKELDTTEKILGSLQNRFEAVTGENVRLQIQLDEVTSIGPSAERVQEIAEQWGIPSLKKRPN